jgi:hypothetical protein
MRFPHETIAALAAVLDLFLNFRWEGEMGECKDLTHTLLMHANLKWLVWDTPGLERSDVTVACQELDPIGNGTG